MASMIACGDKNLIEYNRQRVDEEASKMSVVAGQYSGDLISDIDGKKMGRIKIELRVTRKITPSSGDPSNAQQASFEGVVSLPDQDSTLPFSNGFFDSGSGKFQLSISVTRRNASTPRIDVSGLATAGGLSGTMQVAEYPERGGHFSLTQSPKESIKPMVLGDLASVPSGEPDQVWSATMVLAGEDTAVDLVLQKQSLNDVERALQLFVPTQLVTLAVLYGGVKHYVHKDIFQNAIWDFSKGSLWAENAAESCRLNCIALRLSEGSQGWKCDFARAGVSFKGILFQPKAGQ
jgi:hypothetical protein